MNAQQRRDADKKRSRWLSTLNGSMGGFVRCSCGSQNVDANCHLNADDRVIGVTYTCRDCKVSTKVHNKRRGQLELEQRFVEVIGNDETPDYIKEFLKQQQGEKS
jgi:hypothetical protein